MDSVIDIASQVAAGQRSATDILEQSLQSIDQLNGELNALVSIDAERARQRARDLDARIAKGQPPGALAGVPIAVKDNMCTAWGLTTCASRMLQKYASPFDATVVQRLEAADAIIVGKANLDEYAMGSSTQASIFGPTRNPWDRRHIAGGSSGGSVAAVASGMVAAALGSDTGGSIRQPASFCNAVGLKPGYGRVSRYGLVAFGSSLDQIGPVTRDVRDAARMLQVIAGPDPLDSTCVDMGTPDYESACQSVPQPLRIGVPSAMLSEGCDTEVRGAVESAVAAYRDRGAEIIDIDMPHLEHAVACYYIVCMAEASSNLARFDGVHYGHRTSEEGDIIDLYRRSRSEAFGDEVRRRIMLGTYVLSSGYYDSYYLKALQVRMLIKQDFDRAFERVDVVLSPTSPVPAFLLGEKLDDPLAMYLTDIYTVSANLAGICAASIPCGFTSGGLPIGVQLQAPAMSEDRLLAAAHAYQTWTDWHTRVPADC